MSQVVVATFYKFVTLDALEERRDQLVDLCETHQVRGTIIFAEEGINATIAGSRTGVDEVLKHLRSDSKLADLRHQESPSEQIPFQRLKVRIKPEIVTFHTDVDPTERVGEYVSPRKWNEFVNDPEVLVIDTRNEFEVEYGTFEGSLDPKTFNFSDFPEFVAQKLDPKQHQKVAMFCTGGIRCEKATSLLLEQGFEDVYHLKGGILSYLDEVPKEDSTWKGSCFVFDERETVDHS